MKKIMHENAIDRLMEHFTPEQMREISFALNPDSEDLDWTIYRIEKKSVELDYTIDEFKERLTDLFSLVKDYSLIDNTEFVESLTCHIEELKIIAEDFCNE